MEKHCINCKREVAITQKECYVCGAAQSYVRYYRKTGLVFLLLLSLVTAVGYRTAQKSIRKAVLDSSSLADNKMATITEKLEKLEIELKQEKLKNEQIEASKKLNDEVIAGEKSKLAEFQERAKKAEERSKWLSKENARLKSEVKKLAKKMLTNEQAFSASKNDNKDAANSEIELLRKQLVQFEKQQLLLTSSIAEKRKQLEQEWLQASSGNSDPLSADIITQREQQLDQITKAENEQLLLLNNQIKHIKAKITERGST